ncbi:hypothetical protein B0A50_04792 [Salinomyces thailandicus]|uniref:Uncharacterized protein n=1 Tax=Salinomyces thailandicus TaxID=706561 RepID=A0A4U0TWK8_9PEZI|nr:hypothetical protein B0A50_04792 [Salinomyces thailandica]
MAARPKQFVRFPNHFKDFDSLSWDAKYQTHLDYVGERRSKQEKSSSRKSSQHAPVGDALGDELSGCWLIQCDYVSEEWDYEDFRLRVNQPAGSNCLPTGYFDFGIAEGVMHFGKDPTKLPHRKPKYLDDEHGSESISESDAATELADSPEGTVGERLERTEALLQNMLRTFATAKSFPEARKTIAGLMPNTQEASKSLKRKQLGSAGSGAKKARTRDPHPLRLHLQWRGRETGEGQIMLDHDDSPRNLGHIDFTNNDCVAFNGVISGALFGQETKWSGYKVGDRAPPGGQSWDDYSEESYEAARVGRWR